MVLDPCIYDLWLNLVTASYFTEKCGNNLAWQIKNKQRTSVIDCIAVKGTNGQTSQMKLPSAVFATIQRQAMLNIFFASLFYKSHNTCVIDEFGVLLW